MLIRSAFVSAAALVALAVTTGPASAVDGASSTRPEARVVSVRFSQPTHLARTGSPSANGCHRISGTQTGYNILRDPQWRMTMTAYWCWAAGRVTYRYSDTRVSSPGQLWSFREWLANSSSPARRSMWIRYRQAYFAQCVPLPGGGNLCGNKAFPWMRFSMFGDGTWQIDHS